MYPTQGGAPYSPSAAEESEETCLFSGRFLYFHDGKPDLCPQKELLKTASNNPKSYKSQVYAMFTGGP